MFVNDSSQRPSEQSGSLNSLFHPLVQAGSEAHVYRKQADIDRHEVNPKTTRARVKRKFKMPDKRSRNAKRTLMFKWQWSSLSGQRENNGFEETDNTSLQSPGGMIPPNATHSHTRAHICFPRRQDNLFRAIYSFPKMEVMRILVTRYGSALEAGRRSSK